MLTDTSPMPFGQYKGKPMQDVPVNYLHWCWHNVSNKEVLEYIEKSLDALKMENKNLLWKKQ